jgi:hypothetical protein
LEKLGQYALSVISAAVILSILQSLVQKSSCSGTLLRLIGGIFLTFTVLKPIAAINLDSVLEIPWDYVEQGDYFAEQGAAKSYEQMEAIIKQQCEAYIGDKAQTCNAQLEISVTLTEDDIPKPSSVTLSGSVSPYQKQILKYWLEEELGIQGANQIWIG